MSAGALAPKTPDVEFHSLQPFHANQGNLYVGDPEAEPRGEAEPGGEDEPRGGPEPRGGAEPQGEAISSLQPLLSPSWAEAGVDLGGLLSPVAWPGAVKLPDWALQLQPPGAEPEGGVGLQHAAWGEGSLEEAHDLVLRNCFLSDFTPPEQLQQVVTQELQAGRLGALAQGRAEASGATASASSELPSGAAASTAPTGWTVELRSPEAADLRNKASECLDPASKCVDPTEVFPFPVKRCEPWATAAGASATSGAPPGRTWQQHPRGSGRPFPAGDMWATSDSDSDEENEKEDKDDSSVETGEEINVVTADEIDVPEPEIDVPEEEIDVLMESNVAAEESNVATAQVCQSSASSNVKKVMFTITIRAQNAALATAAATAVVQAHLEKLVLEHCKLIAEQHNYAVCTHFMPVPPLKKMEAEAVPCPAKRIPVPSKSKTANPERSDSRARQHRRCLKRLQRENLKSSFIALRDHVPELVKNDKAAKVQILKKATEYIHSLQAEVRQLQEKKKKLRAKQKQLLKRMEYLQSC